MRQLLAAATATERGDPAASSIMGGALHTARTQGFLNSVITAAPQVTSYVVEHTAQLRSDPFIDQLVAAALEVRVLALLPTSTYLQIAETLSVSPNTVKTHLRSICRKLGVASRSTALERAVDLHLL